jgi:hypothetical protein
MFVSAQKIIFEEQALESGTKHRSKTDKVGRQASQAGQQGSQAIKAVGLACFVWALLLCLVLVTSTCSSKWILY